MDDFMKKKRINYLETPYLRTLLAGYKDDYISLKSTIEAEKKKEAKEVDVNYPHILTDLIMRDRDEVVSLEKIGTPSVISKINSPYTEISKENLKMIKGTLYPEKWNPKAHLELLLFREFFISLLGKESEISYELSQDGSIELIKRLYNGGYASPESNIVYKFANTLVSHELNKIEMNMLGTQEMKFSEDEISLDSAKRYWVLDVFEHLNKSIMMKASARENKRDAPDSIDFYEGKRIKTNYFGVGSSISRIEFESSLPPLVIFLSSTVCGYFFEGEQKCFVGKAEIMNYSMYLADNLLTISLIRTKLSTDEKKFVDYYVSLLDQPLKTRVGMGALYETTCLLMSDQKTLSSSMPILDNLIESIEVSTEQTEKIIEICISVDPETCIKMSSLGKTLILASTNPSKGLSKYTQRTNRDNPVNANTIRRLRSLFRQRVIISYIEKHGRVPNLISVPEDLGAQLEMKAAGGNYLGHMISEISRYDTVRLGKFLDTGKEMNLQSRIIDKACTKDSYDSENNSEKEIQYYISNDMKEVFKNPIAIDKDQYKNKERLVKVVHRKEPLMMPMKKYLNVRLSAKEKEQKTAARFYGIASFKLKLWISSTMEMIKRAMKLLPGQMMTMTDDERRLMMFKMSEKLLSKNSYSLFLDYSGHNTSQRPENTNFILEEIANMYGYYEGTPEFDELTSLSYVFSNINVLVEDSWSDYVYISQGQLGAIEGWLGSLWGIQSQLMIEDMFMQLGMNDYIGTTYSDDSCGVFTQSSLDVHKLNGIIKNVQRYGEDMGLIVKLSQTQVTNGRCSMLKEHYYRGKPMDMSIKKMMSISPNGPKLLGDELESATLIDSGYTSSCTRASEIGIQTLLRNFRTVKLLSNSTRKLIEDMDDNILDERYLASKNNYEISMKMAAKNLSKSKVSSYIPAPRSRVIEFYQFHVKNAKVLDFYLMIMYSPYTLYGYALTPMPDVLISGYSLSNVKRLAYLQGILGREALIVLSKLINLSGNALSYIDNPFPFVGGRKDTKLLIKPIIVKQLPKRVRNPELLKLLSLQKDKEEIDFKTKIVEVFENCFSSRIASKFYECSIYSYISGVISKVDNSTTMKMLLGGRKMMSLINDAWMRNHKLRVKLNEKGIMNYNELVFTRSQKILKYKNDEGIKLNFLEIEEIPIMGKVKHSEYRNMIQPIFKGSTKLTEQGKKNVPPQRTFFNIAKFDRELGVDGMFEHKLIFQAYDLVRYVKWLIMEQERFSKKMNEKDEMNLTKLCNMTLHTFTDASYHDLQEHVVCPKGGRYFHRALTSGFNPKTGDLSSNLYSSNYDITGIDQLLTKTGGADNNLNIQYLLIYVRICLSLLRPNPSKLRSLTLTNDIYFNIKDVTFSLENLNDPGFSETLYEVASRDKIQSRGKLYYNYSTYIEMDEDLENKFIDHVSTTRQEFIEKESAFRSVHSYMLDQMIISPELISDLILEGLIGKKMISRGRERFFDQFYKYYKSLNVIGAETPARSVIRGLLYEELFKVNPKSKKGELWSTEIIKHGYSSGFKDSLMRLFILSTSLSYRMLDKQDGKMKLIVNLTRTVQNSKSNFERIRKGECQFYIKDKRITEMILNSFPTLGYTYSDVHQAATEVCYEISDMEFEQVRLGSYYLKLHKAETNKMEGMVYGYVNFSELEINYQDLLDNLGLDSALKGFETACSLMVSPEQISSPTLSAVYPSARGLLDSLTGNGFINDSDTIIELCGGRGDFHLAMMEKGIKHTTLSREDGYNLAMRIPGMTSKKVSFNCFRQSDYIPYFDHSIILLDISHITEKKDCLSGILGDCVTSKKKVILRLNGLNKFLNYEILQELKMYEIKAYLPVLESPGYVYLTIDASKKLEEEKQLDRKIFTDQLGYSRSILTCSLINSISIVNLQGVISVPPKKVQDQTMEVISDEVLTEMILEEDPEYVHVNPEIKTQVKTADDFKDNLYIYISEKLSIKYKNKLKFLEERLITKGKIEKHENKPKNLIELARKIRRKESDTIEVDYRMLINSKVNIISGVTGMDHNELVEVLNDAMSVKFNKRMSFECWKLILNLSVNEKFIDSDLIVETINIQKFRKDIDRTINSSFEIASKAVISFKTGRIVEGLLAVARLDNVRRRSILNHKDKTTRNNILHYKLYMNRIMIISQSMYVEPHFPGISDRKFGKIWKSLGSIESDIDIERANAALDSIESLNKFFKEMNDEYFSFLNNFDLSVDNMTERIKEEGQPIEALVDTLTAFGLEVTEEDIAKNKELDTWEKVQEYCGEEELFDAWAQEDIGDWGDE